MNLLGGRFNDSFHLSACPQSFHVLLLSVKCSALIRRAFLVHTFTHSHIHTSVCTDLLFSFVHCLEYHSSLPRSLPSLPILRSLPVTPESLELPSRICLVLANSQSLPYFSCLFILLNSIQVFPTLSHYHIHFCVEWGIRRGYNVI